MRRQHQTCGGLKAILVRRRNVFCADYKVLAEKINGFHDVRSDRACRGQQILPKITRLIATTKKTWDKSAFWEKRATTASRGNGHPYRNRFRIFSLYLSAP